MQVLALFMMVAARLGENPAVPFLDAVESISGCISRHLADIQSDLLGKEDKTLNFTPGATVVLPDSFGSFTCRPYCVESQRFLNQVSEETRLSSTSTQLEYYDLRGRRLSLFPAQAAAKTLKVAYLAFPLPVVDMNDDLPFDGTFDFIFKDVVVNVTAQGLELLSNPAFQKYIEDKIAEVMRRRKPVVHKRNGYFD